MDTVREKLSASVRYGKWAGLCGGVFAAVAHQQVVSSWVYTRCPTHPPVLVLTSAILCGIIAIATGMWSLSVRQSLRHDPQTHLTVNTDRFVASLSATLALVMVMFILFSSSAVLFLRCER